MQTASPLASKTYPAGIFSIPHFSIPRPESGIGLDSETPPKAAGSQTVALMQEAGIDGRCLSVQATRISFSIPATWGTLMPFSTPVSPGDADSIQYQGISLQLTPLPN